MAILDPRLLPFIETLADLGMDWLVFELVDGIRRGDEPAEDEHALKLARREKTEQLPANDLERHASADSVPTYFLGDRQLQWAAEYVVERLSDTLDEMSQSIDALDEFFDDLEVKQPEASAAEPLLVLIDEGEESVVGRAQIEAAQAHLRELSEALDVWLRSASPGAAQ